MPAERTYRTAHPKTTVLCLVVCITACIGIADAQPNVPVPTSPTWTPGESLGLSDVGAGELLWRSPAGLVPLPVVGVDVELTVSGVLLHGNVRQIFSNPTNETIEVLYAFPLPERAAVHQMEMVVGARRIRSLARERENARRIYEQAKQSGKKAALLDQHRPNLFTTAAANINPGETIAIELEYLEEVGWIDGEFSLSFPLCFTPRFRPPSDDEGPFLSSDRGDLENRPVRPPARIRVRLRPGTPLDEIASASHGIRFEQEADGYHVRTVDEFVPTYRDFRLRWTPRLDTRPRSAVFIEQRPEASYALMLLLPPDRESEAGSGLPTETLFVVDVSGSMAGPSIDQARHALLAALDRLRPEDRFNLMRFNDGNTTFRDTFEPATPESVEAARAWIRSLAAGGGTLIYPALMRGLDLLGESRSARAQRLVFLTDGAVSNESEVLRGIVDRLGQARLHTIGIGAAPNAYLMRKMAWFGHGLAEFVPSNSVAGDRIDTFFERLDRPVMKDLDLRWDGIDSGHAYPSRLADLHAGQPLTMYVRLDSPPDRGTVSLGGYTRSGWVETSLSLDQALPGRGVATRWARARVDALMDSLHEGAVEDDVRREVIEVGLDFNLVTAYTSLVAVEETPSAFTESRTLRSAAALPMGGTSGPLRLRLGLLLTALGLALYCVRYGSRS
jgi:Ca-activated chloride channel family protein